MGSPGGGRGPSTERNRGSTGLSGSRRRGGGGHVEQREQREDPLPLSPKGRMS